MGRRVAYVIRRNKNSFFPEDPVTPSRVTDTMFIHYNPRLTDFETCENESSSDDDEDLLSIIQRRRKSKRVPEEEQVFTGKWMMFYDISRIDIARGMTALDYAWQFVFPLVDNFEDTRVYSAACSTGYLGYCPKMPDSKDGVICCYTEDYRDVRDVKNAGDSIRRIFHYPHDMHYKTDEATLSGKYKCFGDKYICIYKHTPDCRMYIRDEIDPLVWNPVEFKD